jgi:hypothetical protein
LYSIDGVVPKERFQVPLRIRVFAQASTPNVPEIDLTSWRPDNELTDRPQVEHAAASMVDDLAITASQLNPSVVYDVLAQFAPEFLKEFVTAGGLSVNRYWREAVGRTGEPRRDRRTVPIVGPLYTEGNAKRLVSVLDYGLSSQPEPADLILVVAPQVRFWGGTTLQRDTLSALRHRIRQSTVPDSPETRFVCLFAGEPPRYLEKSFDEVHCAGAPEFPIALEIVLCPPAMMAAVVHAPVGAVSGQAAALGLASFDQKVVTRAQAFVADRLARFVRDKAVYDRYVDALNAGLPDS